MIYDHIKNKNSYRSLPELYSALTYLSTLENLEMPTPNTILIPEKLFCNPVTLTSKPEEACIYEAHKNYIDIHYIVEGCEKIAVSDIANLTTKTPYDSEKDIEFLEGSADGYVVLNEGNFLLCYPHDAHKVAMMHNEPCDIKKVVFKIKV